MLDYGPSDLTQPMYSSTSSSCLDPVEPALDPPRPLVEAVQPLTERSEQGQELPLMLLERGHAHFDIRYVQLRPFLLGPDAAQHVEHGALGVSGHLLLLRERAPAPKMVRITAAPWRWP
jgi:hypothetical protein